MSGMTRQKTIAVRLALAVLSMCLVVTTHSWQAKAAELLMLEDRGCPWCDRWRREIGIAYPKTAEGQRAPLRTLERSRARESGVAFAAPVVVSPTFVLIDNGREVGRITGYPGGDFFWGLLAEMLERLDRKASVSPNVAVYELAELALPATMAPKPP